MTPAPLPARVHTLIVGAGFGGLAMALRLAQSGEDDFLVVDRGTEVGGTWRDNTYPGAACDVPSQLYSYSFATNPDWSRSFSSQHEIQAYLRKTAETSGVLDRFVFETTMVDATYDEGERVWRVETDRGSIVADMLVSAAGGLSEPKLPDIAGMDSFACPIMHSAQWDHSVDLTGKRVAVIGTGASAIQIVPEVAKIAGHLTVFQRTAPWVITRFDRAYTRAERVALRKLPALRRLYRLGVYAGRETMVPGLTRHAFMLAPVQVIALANLRRAIKDPELRASVTPDFKLGCKRMLISNDYYPALTQDNVSLVTADTTEITPAGVVTRDGVEHPVDVLVVATGFYTSELPIAERITGRAGRKLADQWEVEGMSAYKSTTVHHFPNLFVIVGPNCGLGHSSMVYMIESQVAYIADALRVMSEGGIATVEPRADEQSAWNSDLQRRMEPTVWHTGGCTSWYLDKHGRNVTLWPRSTFSFRRLLAKFDPEKYVVAHAIADSPSTPSRVGATA